jgi:Tol biopolymer transport system component
MTKKNFIKLSLAACYIFAAFLAGCFPKDSLQWSKDGSKGIYSKAGALFIVDGNTGSLTQVAPNDTTTRWPAISPDGAMIAFGQVIKVDNVNIALKQLPPNQVKLIETHAEILKQKIFAEGIKDGNFPFIGESEDSFNPQHVAWVQRYVVENADKQLAEKIGPDLINKTTSNALTYCQLVCAPTADPNNRKILATSEQIFWRIRFSPDSRLIAYGADRIKGNSEILEVGFDLYVVAPAGNVPAALVAPATADGYDFKSDSSSIAYIKPEDEPSEAQKFPLGSLVERTLIDPNGKFLAAFEHVDGNDSPAIYVCTGKATELAGVLYRPWMHVYYAGQDRIFFASVKMTLPSSKLDQEKQTIFCLDLFTSAISEITPHTPELWQENLYLFALSGDSRKILVPGNKNTLALYAIGQDPDKTKVIVDTNESFGDDSPPNLVAGWKGSNQLSCLVSEKSRYLTTDPNTPHKRKEIVILDTEGKLVKVLSKDWPDELLNY